MDAALQLAVENLMARYVHAIDDDRLEDWPGFFVEKGRYRITTAENFVRGLPLSIIYADSRAMLADRVSPLSSNEWTRTPRARPRTFRSRASCTQGIRYCSRAAAISTASA